MKLWMVYASADQLRNNTVLSLKDAPMLFELELDGITKNADGYYSYTDVISRFDEAISLGNEYIDTDTADDAA